MTIIIVGLGPGNPNHLTLEAWKTLQAAPRVILRTARHPTVPALPQGPLYDSLDDRYDRAEDFQTLYTEIAREIVALGAGGADVVYAVPGHPLVAEDTVARILALAREQGIPTRIVAGLSFVEPALTALGIDAADGLQIHDAVTVAAMHHPPINPDFPALLAQVYSRAVAGDLKLTLMNQYPDEHPVTLLHAVGTPDERIEPLPLYEIDRSPHIAHLTTLYLPPLPQPGSFERFQETVAHLRAPDGCPWDREQTHQSLRPNLIEEAYEVLAALDSGDPGALREELGDLLLQIVLHGQVATEEGEFRLADVIAAINRKIIHRHPHVWGEVAVSGVGDVVRNWEQIKKEERRDNGKGGSLLDGVPKALPALAQAYSYQARAARVGFDWKSIQPVVDKITEEITEIQAARDTDARAAEIGDLLFALVNWIRWMGVEPETALREANARFYRRFRYIEQAADRAGHRLNEMTLAEMDALWEEAKAGGL